MDSLFAWRIDNSPHFYVEPQAKASRHWLQSIETPNWLSPRADLDLGWELGDGDMRGGDLLDSSMPSNMLDNTGNFSAPIHQLRSELTVGGMSRDVRMERVAQNSSSFPPLGYSLNRLTSDAARRFNADKVRQNRHCHSCSQTSSPVRTEGLGAGSRTPPGDHAPALPSPPRVRSTNDTILLSFGGGSLCPFPCFRVWQIRPRGH